MTTPRVVRVFISSTFRDFIEERDELVKKVFPELRRRCKERFVEVLEVDLRWGITEEQSKSGQTLRICLEEIDRCRRSASVFFIGLLGERYGWIPPRDYFKPDVLEDRRLGWVGEYVESKSVTELEILHGVLRLNDANQRDPSLRDRSFFYFRNEGYQDRHWDAIVRYHSAIDPPLIPEDFTNAKSPDPAVDTAKQADLKRRVCNASSTRDAKSYEVPGKLASLVLEDLWTSIDRIFPASSVPDALERESLEHRVFMESRTLAYVEREGLFEKLDAFVDESVEAAAEPQDVAARYSVNDQAAPVNKERRRPSVRVVLGESGSGKSALLGAWMKKRASLPLFFHFTGATAESVSGAALVRRLLSVLRREGVAPPTENLPHSMEEMEGILPDWLAKLSARGGGILVFDAVNQLASALDRELWWWPEEWPANIRVIFSTLPGDSLRAMKRRGWVTEESVIQVPCLTFSEKREVLTKYLSRFSRTIDIELQEKVLVAPQTENALFLRTVLDELRLRSRHENLPADLDAMLACADPAALFVYVLKNLEKDFTPPEHPGLVGRALGLMGAALRGLSESELLQLLSPGENPASNPLPRHYWAPVYLALEESLVSREGQLNFFHEYLRQAVQREYLNESDGRHHGREAAHNRLAETVTRWSDPVVFNASLRAYGFANGIQHLLANRRVEESTALFLDETYRKAAARVLCDPQPVLKDLARVRHASTLSSQFNEDAAAELTIVALTGARQLTNHLRASLDQASDEGDWESVISLASAERTEPLRLLLACRALTRDGVCPSALDVGALRTLMSRWARNTGKPEWEEVVQRMLPEANDAVP